VVAVIVVVVVATATAAAVIANNPLMSKLLLWTRKQFHKENSSYEMFNVMYLGILRRNMWP
jgi:hypothetical protein